VPDYTCPDCGTVDEPATVKKDTIVGAWAVTCEGCGTTTLQSAYGCSDVEEYREEVAR